MDLIATVITAAVIATGGAEQHHIPQPQPHHDTLDTLRHLGAAHDQAQYLTGSQGREYWKDKFLTRPKNDLNMRLPRQLQIR